jgi:hypothetical protein
MTRVGITGHQRLPDPADWDWVAGQLNDVVRRTSTPIVGISSLAIGADQLFAEIVLKAGGKVETIIPFESYEETFQKADQARFQRLCRMSSRVDVLPRAESDEMSYLAAGKRVVNSSDFLIAVWNGKAAEGLGGTADIVRYAVDQNKRVVHINPANRSVAEK